MDWIGGRGCGYGMALVTALHVLLKSYGWHYVLCTVYHVHIVEEKIIDMSPVL